MTWMCHVDESTDSMYDMIISRGLVTYFSWTLSLLKHSRRSHRTIRGIHDAHVQLIIL